MNRSVLFILMIMMMVLNSCNKGELSTEAGKMTVTQNNKENQGPKDDIPLTDESVMKLDEEDYDFKEIQRGDIVTHVFKFKNVGKKPLVISEVRPSCGCTTPKYTKNPVAPGRKGSITVTFDSSGFDGTVIKTVAVSGNFETKMIRFQAKIN